MDLPVVQLTLDQLLESSAAPPMPEEAPAESANEVLAELKAAQEFLESLTADERYYLRGPIVYHPGSDAGPLLPKFIPQARLDLVLSGEKELATLEEALAYNSSASPSPAKTPRSCSGSLKKSGKSTSSLRRIRRSGKS